jgi:hypothetical protein
MAKDKSKTGSTPKNNARNSDRRNKTDVSNTGSPKPGAGSSAMNQSSDRDRDSEGRFTNESDMGSPKGGASRGSQSTGRANTPDQSANPDQYSQRIDADEDMDDRSGRSTGTPSSR